MFVMLQIYECVIDIPHLVVLVITVLHCFLMFQVAEEIWVCDNGAVTKWQTGIAGYKEHLKQKILKNAAKEAAAKKKQNHGKNPLCTQIKYKYKNYLQYYQVYN